MKETIYTIPVNEVFSEKCECPLCELEARFEKETVDYYLGPSLMEPDNRIETNETGFCARHYGMMYNTQANRLGLGLILDTYLLEQNKILAKLMHVENKSQGEKRGLFGKGKKSSVNVDEVYKYISEHLEQCCICSKLSYTMGRYIEVIFYLYVREKEFRDRFNDGLGFCMPHMMQLIEGAKKHLSTSQQDEFFKNLFTMQINNMERLEKEVSWFTQKFDYRNNDKPWGTSKDALIRGIKKVSGLKELN